MPDKLLLVDDAQTVLVPLPGVGGESLEPLPIAARRRWPEAYGSGVPPVTPIVSPAM